MRIATLLPLLIVLALGSTGYNCADMPMAEDPRIIVPGDVFQFAVSDTVRVMFETREDFGGDLVFEEVAEDSRCPTGVQCVHEGQAVVNLTFYYGDGTVHPVVLRIPGTRVQGVAPAEAPQALAGAFLFRLLRLDPYPDADAGEPDEAVGTFMVERITRDVSD